MSALKDFTFRTQPNLGCLSLLPVPLPISTDRMRQRQPERPVAQLAVVLASMIFQPRRMRGVLVKMLRADVVMLATDHKAKAS